MRLLIDAAAVGEHRVFGVEALSADPLFVHLAGGVVPSLDTLYRDLRRFDEPAVVALEQMMATHGLALVRAKRRRLVYLDMDTTVEPVFGEHEGARPAYNPRYQGRPSYHPILARCAETDTVVGAKLRPRRHFVRRCRRTDGVAWLDRVREATGPKTVIRVRIDAAGDSTTVMRTINEKGAHFLIKVRTTADLLSGSPNRHCTGLDRPTAVHALARSGRRHWYYRRAPLKHHQETAGAPNRTGRGDTRPGPAGPTGPDPSKAASAGSSPLPVDTVPEVGRGRSWGHGWGRPHALRCTFPAISPAIWSASRPVKWSAFPDQRRLS